MIFDEIFENNTFLDKMKKSPDVVYDTESKSIEDFVKNNMKIFKLNQGIRNHNGSFDEYMDFYREWFKEHGYAMISNHESKHGETTIWDGKNK